MGAKLITNGRSIGGVYSTGVMWAFVSKKDEDYELLHDPMTCKDYTHELICNAVHNTVLYSNGHGRLLPLDLEKLQFILTMNNAVAKPDTFKEMLYAAKKVFSDMETAAGLPKTLIKELIPDNPAKNIRTFLFTAKRHFIESPVLLHTFIALMRTIVHIETVVTKKDIVSILQNSSRADASILYSMFKSGTLELLLNEHKNIFTGGVDLKLIYPKESQSNSSYHSGFGPVALQNKCLCSEWYGQNLYKLLEKNNIEL